MFTSSAMASSVRGQCRGATPCGPGEGGAASWETTLLRADGSGAAVACRLEGGAHAQQQLVEKGVVHFSYEATAAGGAGAPALLVSSRLAVRRRRRVLHR